MKLFVRLEAPFEWVRVNGNNVEAFGEVPSLADFPLADASEIVGVIPGEWVTAHRISLPAKSKRQFQTAVPYALEEAISEDVEKLHFVCPNWKAGEELTVYVTAKQKMLEWQSLANENLLALDSLVADHSLLPFHEIADCSISLGVDAAGNQHILANQKALGGVCFDSDFLDIWLMDLPVSAVIAVNDRELTEKIIAAHPDRDVRYWAFGNKLAHWLENTQGTPYDLFADKYQPSVQNNSWRAYVVPASLVAAAVTLVLGYDAFRWFSLHDEIRRIDVEQQQIVSKAFPEIDYVEPSKERFMMEQAILRMGGAGQPLSATAMLANAATVLRRQRVTLANIVYRNSELVISCQLNDFSQVDLLTKQLNARPGINAALQSSAADDGKIIANYSIKAG